MTQDAFHINNETVHVLIHTDKGFSIKEFPVNGALYNCNVTAAAQWSAGFRYAWSQADSYGLHGIMDMDGKQLKNLIEVLGEYQREGIVMKLTSDAGDINEDPYLL